MRFPQPSEVAGGGGCSHTRYTHLLVDCNRNTSCKHHRAAQKFAWAAQRFCLCLSLLAATSLGRGDNPGDELEAWHFRDSHPSPAEGPRRCLRHARGFLVLVPCLESAWHADAFAFGKTGTPWSTIWVGGTPEVLLLGFCTAWISDFFPALCVGGGVGVGSLYVKIVPAFSVSICRQARKVIM